MDTNTGMTRLPESNPSSTPTTCPVGTGHPGEVDVPESVLGTGEPERPVIGDDLGDGVVACCFNDLSNPDEVGGTLAPDGDFDPVADVVLERHHPIVTDPNWISYVACGICGNCWGCECLTTRQERRSALARGDEIRLPGFGSTRARTDDGSLAESNPSKRLA